jgi:hypothetical protein
VVAPAMMWRRDELCYVMCLCHKWTMYCCKHYELSLIYVLKLELPLYCCHSTVSNTCLGGFPSGEAAKTGLI